MKKNTFRILGILGAVLLGSTLAYAGEEDFYKIKKIEVREVSTSQISSLNSAPIYSEIVPEEASPGQPADQIDAIINIGKKIWALIEAGAPVMDIKTDVATALPQGVRSMTELSGWKAPVVKTYEMVITNAFDINVIEFRYRVISVAGGTYGGKGHYVGYATVQPEDVYVIWGWNFNAQASAPVIFNAGSETKPVGAMNFLIDYTISTPFNLIRQSQSYYINGTGELKQLD